jgi:hypothetical protein
MLREHEIKKSLKRVIPAPLLHVLEKFITLLCPEKMRQWHESLDFKIRLNVFSPRPESHLQKYWNDTVNPNRLFLTLLLHKEKALFSSSLQHPVKIFEYGSYCGINLKMLDERLDRSSVQLYALEPNPQAAQFLKRNMPFVNMSNSDDEGFIESSFPGPVDISFTHMVFFQINERRSYSIFKKLSEISRTIIIGENMSNQAGKSSIWDRKQDLYLHPYFTWLKQLGFTIINQTPAPRPYRSISAFCVARRLTK